MGGDVRRITPVLPRGETVIRPGVGIEIVEDDTDPAVPSSRSGHRSTLLVIAALGAVVGLGFLGGRGDEATPSVPSDLVDPPQGSTVVASAPASTRRITPPVPIVTVRADRATAGEGNIIITGHWPATGRTLQILVTMDATADGDPLARIDWRDETTGIWGTTWSTVPPVYTKDSRPGR